MITVKVDVREVQGKLRTLAAGITNRRPVNAKVAIQLYGLTMRNFATQGVTVTGRKWAPLKAGGRYTGSGKNRRFQTNYRILQDTGQLRQSFVHFFDNNQAGVGAQRYAPTSDLRTKKQRSAPPDLAKLHQEGTSRMPQREMLPRLPQASKVALQIYRQHTATAIRSARL